MFSAHYKAQKTTAKIIFAVVYIYLELKSDFNRNGFCKPFF